MKQVSEEFFEQSERLAVESMRAMSAFLAYQGENPIYYHKAKIGAVGVTNHVRLRATENNRAMMELAAKRANVPRLVQGGDE